MPYTISSFGRTLCIHRTISFNEFIGAYGFVAALAAKPAISTVRSPLNRLSLGLDLVSSIGAAFSIFPIQVQRALRFEDEVLQRDLYVLSK